LISTCIFPEDERSETVCKSIFDTLKEKAFLVDQWIAIHETMFDNNHDIPPCEAINLSKMSDGVITTGTCNAAPHLSSLIAEKVKNAVHQKSFSKVVTQIVRTSTCICKTVITTYAMP